VTQPRFFATPADLRAWFADHHETADELLVGFHKVGSGRPSVTWPEAVDEALCVGWIDGVRRRVDETSYTIRFTPRRPRSTWSAVNIKRAAELIAEGRMRPAGLAAFERRTDDRSAIYSYEQRHSAALGAEYEGLFRADPGAWAWVAVQPSSYRKAAVWWVISAKREDTRRRRLATLIDDSAHGRRISLLRRPSAR
jgi:uncharacterized protein YdeI (YjbR/CyaY-like superfamily)